MLLAYHPSLHEAFAVGTSTGIEFYRSSSSANTLRYAVNEIHTTSPTESRPLEFPMPTPPPDPSASFGPSLSRCQLVPMRSITGEALWVPKRTKPFLNPFVSLNWSKREAGEKEDEGSRDETLILAVAKGLKPRNVVFFYVREDGRSAFIGTVKRMRSSPLTNASSSPSTSSPSFGCSRVCLGNRSARCTAACWGMDAAQQRLALAIHQEISRAGERRTGLEGETEGGEAHAVVVVDAEPLLRAAELAGTEVKLQRPSVSSWRIAAPGVVHSLAWHPSNERVLAFSGLLLSSPSSPSGKEGAAALTSSSDFDVANGLYYTGLCAPPPAALLPSSSPVSSTTATAATSPLYYLGAPPSELRSQGVGRDAIDSSQARETRSLCFAGQCVFDDSGRFLATAGTLFGTGAVVIQLWDLKKVLAVWMMKQEKQEEEEEGSASKFEVSAALAHPIVEELYVPVPTTLSCSLERTAASGSDPSLKLSWGVGVHGSPFVLMRNASREKSIHCFFETFLHRYLTGEKMGAVVSSELLCARFGGSPCHSQPEWGTTPGYFKDYDPLLRPYIAHVWSHYNRYFSFFPQLTRRKSTSPLLQLCYTTAFSSTSDGLSPSSSGVRGGEGSSAGAGSKWLINCSCCRWLYQHPEEGRGGGDIGSGGFGELTASLHRTSSWFTAVLPQDMALLTLKRDHRLASEHQAHHRPSREERGRHRREPIFDARSPSYADSTQEMQRNKALRFTRPPDPNVLPFVRASSSTRCCFPVETCNPMVSHAEIALKCGGLNKAASRHHRQHHRHSHRSPQQCLVLLDQFTGSVVLQMVHSRSSGCSTAVWEPLVGTLFPFSSTAVFAGEDDRMLLVARGSTVSLFTALISGGSGEGAGGGLGVLTCARMHRRGNGAKPVGNVLAGPKTGGADAGSEASAILFGSGSGLSYYSLHHTRSIAEIEPTMPTKEDPGGGARGDAQGPTMQLHLRYRAASPWLRHFLLTVCVSNGKHALMLAPLPSSLQCCGWCCFEQQYWRPLPRYFTSPPIFLMVEAHGEDFMGDLRHEYIRSFLAARGRFPSVSINWVAEGARVWERASEGPDRCRGAQRVERVAAGIGVQPQRNLVLLLESGTDMESVVLFRYALTVLDPLFFAFQHLMLPAMKSVLREEGSEASTGHPSHHHHWLEAAASGLFERSRLVETVLPMLLPGDVGLPTMTELVQLESRILLSLLPPPPPPRGGAAPSDMPVEPLVSSLHSRESSHSKWRTTLSSLPLKTNFLLPLLGEKGKASHFYKMLCAAVELQEEVKRDEKKEEQSSRCLSHRRGTALAAKKRKRAARRGEGEAEGGRGKSRKKNLPSCCGLTRRVVLQSVGWTLTSTALPVMEDQSEPPAATEAATGSHSKNTKMANKKTSAPPEQKIEANEEGSDEEDHDDPRPSTLLSLLPTSLNLPLPHAAGKLGSMDFHLPLPFLLCGDHVGRRCVQEAVERRVAIYTLMARPDLAVECLRRNLTYNAFYVSLAMVLSAITGYTPRGLCTPPSKRKPNIAQEKGEVVLHTLSFVYSLEHSSTSPTHGRAASHSAGVGGGASILRRVDRRMDHHRYRSRSLRRRIVHSDVLEELLATHFSQPPPPRRSHESRWLSLTEEWVILVRAMVLSSGDIELSGPKKTRGSPAGQLTPPHMSSLSVVSPPPSQELSTRHGEGSAAESYRRPSVDAMSMAVPRPAPTSFSSFSRNISMGTSPLPSASSSGWTTTTQQRCGNSSQTAVFETDDANAFSAPLPPFEAVVLSLPARERLLHFFWHRYDDLLSVPDKIGLAACLLLSPCPVNEEELEDSVFLSPPRVQRSDDRRVSRLRRRLRKHIQKSPGKPKEKKEMKCEKESPKASHRGEKLSGALSHYSHLHLVAFTKSLDVLVQTQYEKVPVEESVGPADFPMPSSLSSGVVPDSGPRELPMKASGSPFPLGWAPNSHFPPGSILLRNNRSEYPGLLSSNAPTLFSVSPIAAGGGRAGAILPGSPGGGGGALEPLTPSIPQQGVVPTVATIPLSRASLLSMPPTSSPFSHAPTPAWGSGPPPPLNPLASSPNAAAATSTSLSIQPALLGASPFQAPRVGGEGSSLPLRMGQSLSDRPSRPLIDTSGFSPLLLTRGVRVSADLSESNLTTSSSSPPRQRSQRAAVDGGGTPAVAGSGDGGVGEMPLNRLPSRSLLLSAVVESTLGPSEGSVGHVPLQLYIDVTGDVQVISSFWLSFSALPAAGQASPMCRSSDGRGRARTRRTQESRHHSPSSNAPASLSERHGKKPGVALAGMIATSVTSFCASSPEAYQALLNDAGMSFAKSLFAKERVRILQRRQEQQLLWMSLLRSELLQWEANRRSKSNSSMQHLSPIATPPFFSSRSLSLPTGGVTNASLNLAASVYFAFPPSAAGPGEAVAAEMPFTTQGSAAPPASRGVLLWPGTGGGYPRATERTPSSARPKRKERAPLCTICGEWLDEGGAGAGADGGGAGGTTVFSSLSGVLTGGSGGGAGERGGAGGYGCAAKPAALKPAPTLPPLGLSFAWCTVCLHGGHLKHLEEWFQKHERCPVEGCWCKCCF